MCNLIEGIFACPVPCCQNYRCMFCISKDCCIETHSDRINIEADLIYADSDRSLKREHYLEDKLYQDLYCGYTTPEEDYYVNIPDEYYRSD